MPKNKLTLLIDGNWLMMSRMAMYVDEFDKSKPTQSKQKASENLKDFMAKSINVIINRFKDIDNIIFLSDGGSWRKKVVTPVLMGDETYKGNRTHDSELDWNYIYKAFNELFASCKNSGITCSQCLDCEGDDWVWYWSTKLNEEGINCLIWSSDNDLKQLIRYDEINHSFTAWYNDNNGLYLPNNLDHSNDDPLQFFMSSDFQTNAILESIKPYVKKDIYYINPIDIVIDKIFQGDSGDNVKPIILYKKGARNYKLSKKEFREVVNKFNIKEVKDLEVQRENISEYLANKFKKYNIPSTYISDMIFYNTTLVWLNKEVIPEEIVQNMEKNSYYNICDIGYIRSNYRSVLGDQNIDIESIFDSI